MFWEYFLLEEINQWPKRLREQNNPLPDIFVETPSTTNLVEESGTINPNFLSPGTHNLKKCYNYLANKLNRLKDKQVRFKSHKEFLSRSITDVLAPKRLKLMLDPPIGNHEQNFLDNWYSKLKQFSLSVKKDIVKFCDQTIDATTTEITTTITTQTKNNLKWFRVRLKAIKNNEAATKKTLQQQKLKKFNTLKYKLKATGQPLSKKKDCEKNQGILSAPTL